MTLNSKPTITSPRRRAADRPADRRDVDLHVHTVSSGCGFIRHRRVLDIARAAGKGIVAVTDHDSAAGALAVRSLAAQTGDDVLVLIGIELSTSDLGHVIVFGRGVEDDWGWQPNSPFPRHIPDHWLTIQAHPYRDKVTWHAGVLEVRPLPPLPERIDAVEIWNGGDLIKRVPHLRAELDAVSRDYASRNGKTGVASSDSHRAHGVHSFFTRFARPIENIESMIDQVRNGEVTPQAADQAHLDWCIEGWRRRQLIEWCEEGREWHALAASAGYDPDSAARCVSLFKQVQALHARGAELAQIADETGLSPLVAADYLDIAEEELHSATKRVARLTVQG